MKVRPTERSNVKTANLSAFQPDRELSKLATLVAQRGKVPFPGKTRAGAEKPSSLR